MAETSEERSKVVIARVAYVTAAILLVSFPAFAATAFFDREYTTGQTKTCIYKFLGSEYAITIKAYQMCPYSIKV
jgi:hypothetical protein